MSDEWVDEMVSVEGGPRPDSTSRSRKVNQVSAVRTSTTFGELRVRLVGKILQLIRYDVLYMTTRITSNSSYLIG